MSFTRITPGKLHEKKRKGEKIVCITAYDFSLSKLVDSAGVDLILVGDSLSMVVLGNQTTLEVTLDEMIHHTRAAARGAKNAMVVGDMPFLTYKVDVKEAVLNAGRFMQEGGAHAVKLEGGTEMAATVRAIVNADIPVCGHVGLTPQAVHQFGGFLVQAKTSDAAKKLVLDAINLQEAGAFAIVLESIPWEVARLVTEAVDIPTIGIGAGPHCDGQILVLHDMLGIFTDFKPKFLKYFGNIGEAIKKAVGDYKAEVEAETYPDVAEHVYSYPGDSLQEVKDWISESDLHREAAELRKRVKD